MKSMVSQPRALQPLWFGPQRTSTSTYSSVGSNVGHSSTSATSKPRAGRSALSPKEIDKKEQKIFVSSVMRSIFLVISAKLKVIDLK